ncbi:MAG: sulfite exporter TauE/SafE family protein [Betaproteobacteria bacterium]|nr:sulfite exporter TauE/SafE family protein [Betaproteobacteria bacterium]
MSFADVMVALVLLGTVAGFLAGMLGVGGALMMIPFITFLLGTQGVDADSAVKMAIATGMSTIVVTSLASTRAHHKLGAVRWDLVKGLAPGILLGSALSSLWLFAVLKGSALALFFAGFTAFSATQMVLDKKPKPSRQMPGTVGQTAVGSVIGLLSGLVGAGGAFVSIPFMTWCNVPIVVSGWNAPHNLAWSFGYIWLPGLVVIGLCTMVTAAMGARLAHKMPVSKLKRGFALLLFLLASYMLYRGLSS